MPANELGTATITVGWVNPTTGAGTEDIHKEYSLTLPNFQQLQKDLLKFLEARLDESMKKHAK